MYQPELVNDVANWIVLVAVVPFSIFTILYGILAPWYRSYLGAVMFGLIASTTGVLGFVLARRLFGEFPGYEWWAITLYSLLTFFALSFLIIFIVERRNSQLIGLPISRRKDHDGH